MSEKNKALIRRWFEEVWNQGRSDVIDELLAEDAVIHGLVDGAGNPVNGLDGFHDFHTQFRGAFPDLIVSVDDTIGEGDMVVARCSVRGKHTGNHLGFAATNAPVQFDGVAITRIENGKIAEAWNHFDFAQMNRQLGL
ncbi:MAG TPA: ester cyclase [Pyrinomonadaceae bacterium]|nr:ester cyclase [Pyrinomonadaceae bacterium]